MTSSTSVQSWRGYCSVMKSIACSLALLAAPAFAQDPAATPAAEAENQLQDCNAHKFETVVERIVDGEPRQSRIRLCGKQGQSDADWIVTLEDAITKLRDSLDVPAETRTQAIAALEGEIARLRDPAGGKAQATAPVLTPRAVRPRDFRDDYASLPALPPPTSARPVAPPPAMLIEAVPTVRTTPPAAATGNPPSVPVARSVAAQPVAPAALGPAPNVEFACYVPGDLVGPAPCIDFQRDTLITIRAKSDVPAGTQIHFERNGTDRASVTIGPLKRGRSVRVPLPNAVCAGVGDGRLAIAVWNGSRPALSEGPYTLRCT